MDGKTSVNFKARSINKRIMMGPVGIPPKTKERNGTQFMEFDLSYKKTKEGQNNQTPGNHWQVSHGKKTPGSTMIVNVANGGL